MTPQEFVNRWQNPRKSERQIAHAHFLELCQLFEIEMPGGGGKTDAGETFVFEESTPKTQGSTGAADVYYENHFAIEYKTPNKYKNLNEAYQQLLGYREGLKNPPLLVVTDINNWEIHTNFPNTEKTTYTFQHSQIASDSVVRGWLRDMFHAPHRLNPRYNSEQVTREAAAAFQIIADNMRDWDAEPQRIAFFLTKLVFCLFAEDIGLLPLVGEDNPRGIFTHIVQQSRRRPSVFKQYVQNLFVAMNEGGETLMHDIPYFNGTLFNVVTVEDLKPEALDALAKAADLDWSDIEPSIFGTLFERSLDPAKRSQLGAHYTSRDDILLIVEPVLMQPLRYHWDTVQLQAAPIREAYDKARTGKARKEAEARLLELRGEILARIRNIKVLDPACGSGNFLYIALQSLLDLEKAVIDHPLWKGLQRPVSEVHPRQMYGIEINPIAHALASIVVWIGYIQWRRNIDNTRVFAEPILEVLEGNIVCKDAILPPANPLPSARAANANPPRSPHQVGGKATPHAQGEVEWPKVDVIIGNPPFLGAKFQKIELGDDYVERLRHHYEGRIPAFVDLACYWFETARDHIDRDRAKRAGLLATNSIRDGASRVVLERIKETGDIFMAWSDREWFLDEAAVHFSMVGFDRGLENLKSLDGLPVTTIHADLTSEIDLTITNKLDENEGISFIGVQKGGDFDISDQKAKNMLASTNASGCDNADVIARLTNGSDILRRPRNRWIINFEPPMALGTAKGYALPFAHIEERVFPARQKLKMKRRRVYWWLHAAPALSMRRALRSLTRYVCTSLTAKHRVFVWIEHGVICDSTTVAIARDDDYFFGVLHSKLHEVWSLRMGTSLEDRPRYTPTTTFETFPFPWPPGQEDESHPAHARISAAARQLHAERHAWLHPDGASAKELKDRTLTNLYNALQVFRGESAMRVKPAAADFAPRLDTLHRALDEAVCEAYGWDAAVLDDEEEILRRLLALNLERAAQSG